MRFFSALQKFNNPVESEFSQHAIKALAAIVKNPNGYLSYQHQKNKGENINAQTLISIELFNKQIEIFIDVSLKGNFYELKTHLIVGDLSIEIKDIELSFQYFLQIDHRFYLINDIRKIKLLNWLKDYPDKIQIHQSQYLSFKKTYLHQFEDYAHIQYNYIKQATQLQLKNAGFLQPSEKIIYLSDFGEHVMLIPVMAYGEAEVQVRSRKQVYGIDKKQREFLVERDDDAEVNFIALLTKQHPYFAEQLENGLHYFYLHKKHFLNSDWFLETFEVWQNQGITVLGFNELENNHLNLNKAKISIKIISGLNWFNANIKVSFGTKRASLKHLHKAIRNKHKYVQLDDGTLGILPEEWIKKFADYFNLAYQINDDELLIAKTNFVAIHQLFDEAQIDEKASTELKYLNKQLSNYQNLAKVETPNGLKAELRDYQKQGLSWLNFLDDFNFGGILADEMGLGKTLQILAFILLQNKKIKSNTNLLVLPNSLIFNWLNEVEKFAPELKVLCLHGTQRPDSTDSFSNFQLIITTYTTLLSDVNFIKNYEFNYVFLDESQAIKNPESQRYKAVCLLKARNRIAITGTPLENNTYDLYGQLSFACPSLLGNKQYFKDIYAMPIDMFKDGKKAKALQQKVKPFILRRTKAEVDLQLPTKTDMVVYCEMQTEQRKIYEAYEKEFREYISAISNDELRKNSMNVLMGLTRLRQICNSPKLLKGDRLPGNESVKIDVIIKQLKEHSAGHKILVFSQFVEMLNLIKEQLENQNIDYAFLTGKTVNREEEVNKFQQQENTRVFLISLKAGGVGLNLTEADYVYIIDPWWNPAVENQAIDRAHRIGQYKKVIAVRLICTDTVEEKMIQLQQRKKELFNQVIDADKLNLLNKDDLLSVVS